MASSTASRLTVTRPRPASRNERAFAASREPFVVSASSIGLPLACGQFRELFDQGFESTPQERLAAGDADFLHPEQRERFRELNHLFERQAFRRRQEPVVCAEGVPRHAVRTAEIALIDDGQP